MGGLRKLAAAALACAALAAGALAQAAVPAQVHEVSAPKIAIPGQAGWKASCSNKFLVQNWLEYSNSSAGSQLATGTGTASYQAPWTASQSTSSLPSVTSLSDLDPTGGGVATDISIPAVSGGSGYAVVSEQMPSAAGAAFYGWTVQLNARDLSPAVAGNLFFILANSTHTKFKSVPIPAQTWPGGSPLVLNVPPSWGGQFYVEIGVDRRDPAETGALVPGAAKTAAVYGAQAMPLIRGPGRYVGDVNGGPWPLVTTTSTPGVGQTVSINCPPGVAFRGWDNVRPWIASGVTGSSTAAAPAWNGAAGITMMTRQVSTLPYEQGGVSEPFLPNGLQSSGPYAGQFAGLISMTDGTLAEGNNPGAHNDWYDIGVAVGPTPFSVAELAPGGTSAQIHVAGAVNQAAPPVKDVIASLGSYTPGSGAGQTTTLVLNTTAATNLSSYVGQTVNIVGPTGASSGAINAIQTQWTLSAASGTQLTLTNTTTAVQGLTLTAISSGYVAVGNEGTTPQAQIYMLHPVWVPGGGTINGTWYQNCAHVSANPIKSTLMACATSGLGSPWTWYEGPAQANGYPTYVINPTFDTPANAPNLPTDIFVPGQSLLGSNLVYTTVQGNGSASNNFGTKYPMQLWVAPVGDGGGGGCGTGAPLCGSVWNAASGYTYAGFASQGILATDFDQQPGQLAEHLDPDVYPNRCGFYERYSTSYIGSPLFGDAQVTASGGATGYNAAAGIMTLQLNFGVAGIIKPGMQITTNNAGGLSGSNLTGVNGGPYTVTAVSPLGAATPTISYKVAANLSPAPVVTGQASYAPGTYAVQVRPAPKDQIIVEEVSDSQLGPWFMMSEPAIPITSSLYNNATTIGESQVFTWGSHIFWTGNVDNGFNGSAGVEGFQTDVCQ